MIVLKSLDEIEKIRRSCRVVVKVLLELSGRLKPGVQTYELDRFAENRIHELGGVPAFKDYNGYPASLCISINSEVVHGIPSKRKIRTGDIVSLDLGVLLDGFYGDAAVTLPVGKISADDARLISATKEALMKGIEKAVPGSRLGDISSAIQAYLEERDFSVVRDFVGHGIGRSLHEDPQIPNFGVAGNGVLLKSGMVLAVEPMVNAGGYQVYVKPDKWTTMTLDGSHSAHWEHTIAITPDGPIILTDGE